MSNVNDFVIENGVLKEYIGSEQYVFIPEGVRKIGNNVFSYRNLYGVSFPESVTSIGMAAFAGNKFSTVILPKNLSEIGANAFISCINLKEITIPDSVTKIGSKAFKYCVSLKNIIVGEGVMSVGSDAFSDTHWLNNQKQNFICAGKTLISVTEDTSDVEIPENILSIADNGFHDKNVKTLVIPETVKLIGNKAFAACENLERVLIKGVPEFGKDCFFENAVVIADKISIDEIKPKILKHQMILGYFFNDKSDSANNTVPQTIIKYISRNFDKLISDMQSVPGLFERILDKKALNLEQIDILLEKQKGNIEICAPLLEYKNRNFTETDV